MSIPSETRKKIIWKLLSKCFSAQMIYVKDLSYYLLHKCSFECIANCCINLFLLCLSSADVRYIGVLQNYYAIHIFTKY